MLRQLLTGRSSPRRQAPKLNILNLEERLNPGAFSPGNLVVYRVGDGVGSLANTGNAVFIDEYLPSTANQATTVQSIAMPTTASGAQKQLIASGTASSEGLISRSANGEYLFLTGYSRDLGGSGSVVSTASGTVNRTVGRITAAGVVDTSTALTDFADANNPRSVASTNGTDIWVTGGAGGVRYTTFGSTSSTQLSTTLTNIRQASIFDSQLYVSTGSGSAVRVGTVGTGTPTTNGQTITNLPGFLTSGSPYAFFLADLTATVAGVDTLYVVDDTASTGGVQKFSLVSGNWVANGTADAGSNNYRGLTAKVTGTTVQLFAVRKGGTAAAGGGELVSFTDSTGYNTTITAAPTITILATAAANTAFRGVAFTPESSVVNTAPTLNGANNFTAINEDETANTGTLVTDLVAGQITDPDAGALKGIAITGTVTTNGTWQFTTNGGTNWTNVGSVSANSALLLKDDANTSVRFVPNADFNGTISDGITFRAWDQTSGSAGSTADTGTNGTTTAFSTATASSSIVVNALNDAPINTVPAAATVGTNETYTFAGNLSIADADAGTAPVQVGVTVAAGTLTLSGTTGLSFTTGTGTGDAMMVFSGTISDINAALNGAFFTAPATTGNVVFTIVTNDQGNTGGAAESDTDFMNFNVTNIPNEAPVNQVPFSQLVDEDGTLTFGTGNAISISDVDAGTANVQVTLTATNGTLSLSGTSGLTFTTGDGTSDASMVFTGSITDINTALNNSTFTPTPNYAGAASVQIITNDLGNTGLGGAKEDNDTVSVNVTPFNDDPVNTVPAAITTIINSSMIFTGNRAVSIADLDADPGDVKITLNVTAGSLSLASTAGLLFTTGDGDSDADMVFTGTVTNVNAALAGMTFHTPSTAGSVTFTITTDDQGNTGFGGAKTDTDTVTINVVDAPVISEILFNPPGTDAPNEYVEIRGVPNSTIPAGTYLLGIEGDGGTGAGDVQTIFNLSGLTIGSNGFLVFSQFNNTYTINANATSQVSSSTGFGGLTGIYSADSGGTDIENTSVTFMLVQTGTAPALTDDIDSNNDGTPDGAVYTAWTVVDAVAVVDAATDAGYASLVYANNGVALAPAGATIVNVGTSTPNYIGRSSDNIGLNASDWVAGGTAGTAPNFNLVGGQTTPLGFGGDLLNHIGSPNFPDGAFNNDPTLTVVEPAATNEDTAVNYSFTVADVDVGTGFVDVTLTASNGTLTLASLTGLNFNVGDGDADATMSFFGTLANVNAALASVTLQPNLHFVGTNTLDIVVSDLGNTGDDGAKTVTGSYNVDFAAVNDAPEGTDKTVTIFNDQTYIFTVADFGFTDPNDAVNNNLQGVFIASVTGSGQFLLSGNPVLAGTTVSLADINSGFLTYHSDAGTGFPLLTFTFQVQDDGGTTNGGVDLDPTPNTFAINSRTPNQPPIGTPTTVAVLEDGSHTFTVADFGFTDPNGLPTHNFFAVKIGTLPSQGTFTLNNVAVTANQFVSVADINSGLLVYTPTPGTNGTNYASFLFQVQDDGGTLNGGVDLDVNGRLLTLDVLSVNDAPSGADFTVDMFQNDTYSFSASDFTLTDVNDSPSNTLQAIQISSLPALGTLTFNGNPAVVGDIVTVAQLNGGLLQYEPAANDSGLAYTSFTFQVVDNGGITNGGSNTDPTANTVTFDVIIPNQEPNLFAIFPSLNPVVRNTVNGAGQTVASFIGSSIFDVDVGDPQGIAVFAAPATVTQGTWEYSIDGGTTWATLTGASYTAARLLRATDLVRFSPATGFVGRVYMEYRAWDQFAGAAGGTFDLTAFNNSVSVDQDTAQLDVGVPLTNVAEDTKSPKGDTTASALATYLTDPDTKAKSGIAIVSQSGTQYGTWQYNVGGWKKLTIPNGQAVLLSSTTRIRFVPFANTTGVASIAYHAWDQTAGKNGATVPFGATGDGTAFSSTIHAAIVTVTAVNDAPVLDVSGNPTLTPVLPGATNPAGDLVGNVLGSTATDVEGDAIRMAITKATGTGMWQSSSDNGASWQGLGVVNAKTPKILLATDKIRFVPAVGFNGLAKLTYKAVDASHFSKLAETATLAVTPFVGFTPNTAPVLNTTPVVNLVGTAEDTKAPTGTLVATLLGTSVTDPDLNPKKGVAITGLTNIANGTWQYSQNGKSWKAIGTVATTNALLLRDTDLVRFLPGKDFHGTATLTFHAWDQTQGGSGFRADVSKGMGGNGAFSIASDTATITITPVNDAPVLDSKPTPTLTSILPTNSDPAGDTVASILGFAATDVDGDGLRMAVTAASGNGLWQHKAVGAVTWTNLGIVSNLLPKLLLLTDQVRFVPASTFSGVAKLTYKASDASLTSKASETANLTVNAIDDRPVLNTKIKPVLVPTTKNATNPLGTAVNQLLQGAVTDADATAVLGIAVTSADGKNGVWQFSTDSGTTWEALGVVSVKTPKFLAPNALLRFVPNANFVGTAKISYKAWDSASMNPTGVLAVSSAIASATVTVNTAPVLS